MGTILITGANGFLGFYLMRLLLSEGREVLATGKGECRLPFTGNTFRYASLDFTDHKAVARCMEEFRPEVIIHAGALSKPDQCELEQEEAFRVNVEGTRNLLQEAAKHGSHFIFISTDFVFSGEDGPYAEDALRRPVNYYGQTKLLAEDEVMAYPLTWSIVRTVLVYGRPFLSRQNLLTVVREKLEKGEELRIFTDQVRTPTYVEDLAAAIVEMIRRRAQGVFHISGRDTLTTYEMALAVAQHLGLNSGKIIPVVEESFAQPARRPPVTGFVIDKAARELNFVPLSFEEGLRRTFDERLSFAP
jgi:dTDP-4-dehydrorhamnose reductase